MGRCPTHAARRSLTRSSPSCTRPSTPQARSATWSRRKRTDSTALLSLSGHAVGDRNNAVCAAWIAPPFASREKRFHCGSFSPARDNRKLRPKTSLTTKVSKCVSDPAESLISSTNQLLPYTVANSTSSRRPISLGAASTEPKSHFASSMAQKRGRGMGQKGGIGKRDVVEGVRGDERLRITAQAGGRKHAQEMSPRLDAF